MSHEQLQPSEPFSFTEDDKLWDRISEQRFRQLLADTHTTVHLSVSHCAGEFANGPAHVNIAESWNALLKRGVYGTFHHISEKHMDRYASEFVFRWNNREVNDFERTLETISSVDGSG